MMVSGFKLKRPQLEIYAANFIDYRLSGLSLQVGLPNLEDLRAQLKLRVLTEVLYM